MYLLAAPSSASRERFMEEKKSSEGERGRGEGGGALRWA